MLGCTRRIRHIRQYRHHAVGWPPGYDLIIYYTATIATMSNNPDTRRLFSVFNNNQDNPPAVDVPNHAPIHPFHTIEGSVNAAQQAANSGDVDITAGAGFAFWTDPNTGIPVCIVVRMYVCACYLYISYRITYDNILMLMFYIFPCLCASHSGI